MRLSIKSAVAGVSTLAVAGSMVIGFGGVASAATPPYDPASNGATQGTLSLYNASGQQITTGSLSTPPAYVQADTDTGRPGDNKASIYAATPVKGANALTWPNDLIASAKTYPDASAPANLQGALALGSGIFSWLDPSDPDSYATAFPNTNSDPLWQNLYQLRILTSGAGQAVDPSRYASLSIQIDTSAGTWTQVYPTVADTPTTTTLTANPVSPTDAGTPITLTATVSPSGAGGTVDFKDGGTLLGSAPVTAGSAQLAGVTLNAGSHSLSAVLQPSAGYATSSGSLTYQSNQAAAVATNTALSVNPTSGPAYANVTMHADVTRQSDGNALSAGSGTVKFFDNGSQIGSSSFGASGADFSTTTLGQGAHSLTAQFVASNPQNFVGSTSAAIDANYDAPACTSCTDPQNFKVNVPAGSLSITTPYTVDNPFDLGTMQLDTNGINLTAGAQFPNPGDSPLAITDTRAGDLAWTAYVTSTDFTGPGTIDGTGLSYTNVTPSYIAGNALNSTTKPVVTNNVASVKGGPHQFASAVHGSGSVYIDGRFDLTAPSSTPAGLYTATVTFTIS